MISASFNRVYRLLQLAIIVIVMIMLDITVAISFHKKNIKNYIKFPMKVTITTINTPMIADIDVSINSDETTSVKLCRICKTYYNPLQNTMKSCRFHKGS
jgi:hypothetical protein